MEGVGIVREQFRSKAVLFLHLRRVGFRGLGFRAGRFGGLPQ